jgi:integrase
MDSQFALVPLAEYEILPPEVEEQPQFTPADFARAIAQAVVAAQDAPKLSEYEKERLYPIAFEEWLYTNPRTGDPRPQATIDAYKAAWEDFRLFCPKRVWLVEGLDVRAWVHDLRTRPINPAVARGLVKNGRRAAGQMGLSPATVNQYISAISAFYSYCEGYEIHAADGRTIALYDGLNPAKSQIVKRPKTHAFHEVVYLDSEQIRSLLAAAKSTNPRNQLKALRDHAMLLCYVSTGARNSEIRLWQWKNIQNRGAVVYYTWSNKGKSGMDELPAAAWQAVKDYLAATGRLSTIQPTDYIFTPLGDSATHFRRADGTRPVDPETWTTNRPLSGQEVNRNLRVYARRAGLDNIVKLHVHCLRHSAYMLYREAGVDLEERSRLLHHSSLAITTQYDHRVGGQRNTGWAKAAGLLGL